MKVTTELKNLINRQFQDKADAIRKEFNDNASKIYQDTLDAFTESKEWKDFVKAANKLKEKLDDIKGSDDHYAKQPYSIARFEHMVSIAPKDFIRSNIGNYLHYDKDASKQLDDKLNALALQKEALLIKLAYEKDFEKIQAMLAECGITL